MQPTCCPARTPQASCAPCDAVEVRARRPARHALRVAPAPAAEAGGFVGGGGGGGGWGGGGGGQAHPSADHAAGAGTMEDTHWMDQGT